MLNEQKTKVVSENIQNLKGDTKGLFAAIYSLVGKSSDNPLPTSNSDQELANEFASFFLKKITDIRDQLNDIPLFEPETREDILNYIVAFKPMSKVDTKKNDLLYKDKMLAC
jgi:hypothetical protein